MDLALPGLMDGCEAITPRSLDVAAQFSRNQMIALVRTRNMTASTTRNRRFSGGLHNFCMLRMNGLSLPPT